MSEGEIKGVPEGPPPDPIRLVERLDRALKEPEVRREVHVRLSVEGGHAGERYEFRLRLSGTGDAEISLLDNLRGRREEGRIAQVTQRDVTGLLRALDVQALLLASGARPRIPPGSVVGRLEVSDGQHEVSALFMADPGQAESTGYRMPPGLAKALERLYELGAKHLGVKDIRP